MISYQNKWTWRCVERWETMKINYQRWRRNLSLREKWSRKPADVSSPKCSQGPGDWLQTAAPVWGRKCQIRDFVEFNSIRGYSCLLGVQNTAQLPYKDDGLKRWSRGGTTKQIFFLTKELPHSSCSAGRHHSTAPVSNLSKKRLQKFGKKCIDQNNLARDLRLPSDHFPEQFLQPKNWRGLPLF